MEFLSVSEQYSVNPDFSHIYLEKEALNYEDTHCILNKYPKSTRIVVDHYKDVFARSGQDWRLQKKSMNLILAVRKDQFLYTGSEVTPDFGYDDRFFYNALVLNCIYDCDYCYLQGMFPSANVVMFVNNDDYIQHTLDELKNGPMYLAVSYDTDLLAFEKMIPYCSRWIETASENPELVVEIRSKSANYRAIQHHKPVDNVILAWTLSPDTIARLYEKRTPPLKSRLKAINAAIEDGWQVRICIDPIMRVQNWKDHYAELIETLSETVPLHKVSDFSVGVFRMSKDYLKRIRKQRSDTDVLYHDYETKDGVTTYKDDDRKEMERLVVGLLKEHVLKENIEVL
ncbi:MAG TPA: hypothetical protein VKA34_17165 [Balneolales bacterium]|nr:hypothetical protein [Balneolales bacterium]